MTDTITNICVFFEASSRCAKALQFATSLVRDSKNTKLRLLVKNNTTKTELNAHENQKKTDAQAFLGLKDCPLDRVVEQLRIREILVQEYGLIASQYEITAVEEHNRYPSSTKNCVVVDFDSRLCRAEAPILYPMEENGNRKLTDGTMLIAFSNSQSALESAQLALPLAQALNMNVIFYHTTWKAESETGCGKMPADHMCARAKQVQTRLEHQASAAGVSFETIIETADDITDGLIQCALRKRCRMIVVARGKQTMFGSYVSQVLDKSPVPVLVTPQQNI